MPIQVEVWGDYACFTRPEMKTERVSYDVMTPSAARGLLESVYWHPGLRWMIDRIRVCSPIRFTNIPPQRGEGCHQRQQGESGDERRDGRTVSGCLREYSTAGGHGAAGRPLCHRRPL